MARRKIYKSLIALVIAITLPSILLSSNHTTLTNLPISTADFSRGIQGIMEPTHARYTALLNIKPSIPQAAICMMLPKVVAH